MIGYLKDNDRLYLTDKDFNIVSYYLSRAVLDYQTAILREDLAEAEKILADVPADQRSRVARFLESQNLKELALNVSMDPEHKFELAVQLEKLDVAYRLAQETDSEHKWKQLADLALADWQYKLAEDCLIRAKDVGGLLLFYSSYGDIEGLRKTAQTACTLFVCLLFPDLD